MINQKQKRKDFLKGKEDARTEADDGHIFFAFCVNTDLEETFTTRKREKEKQGGAEEKDK